MKETAVMVSLKKNTVKNEIKKIIVKIIGKIKDDQDFKYNSNWDSLIQLKIIFEIEKKLSLKIKDQHIYKLININKILNFYEKNKKK